MLVKKYRVTVDGLKRNSLTTVISKQKHAWNKKKLKR